MIDIGTIEKGAVANDEARSSSPDTSLQPPFDKDAERRLVRKIDLRLLPVLWILQAGFTDKLQAYPMRFERDSTDSMMYWLAVNFLDRANIGNAKIQGMESELNLIGQRFNIAVWIFNVGYLVAGVPAITLFKKYGPKSLCVMIFLWAICVIGCGLVKTWEELVVCRLLEGMTEAGFVAGSAYLIGRYYKKDEYLSRYVIFFSASILAGAVNGFLCSLIARMDGTAGYDAWRWIFIIEGLITIGVSIFAWVFIVPFPEHATFLKEEEKQLLLARTRADGGDVSQDEISYRSVLTHLNDWKIWVGVFMNVGVQENANSIANFQPTVIKGLGYTATQAQVYTIPVYIAGAAFSLAFAYLSDYFRRRYFFYLLGWTVLVSGLIIEIVYPKEPGVRYMGLFFMACGCYLAMPIALIWIALNAGKGYKRAVSLAATVNFGTAGAFVSSNVFLYRETPRFHTGFSTGLGLACMSVTAATIIYVGCRIENRKRDERRKQLPDILEDNPDLMGDKHPDFRFSL